MSKNNKIMIASDIHGSLYYTKKLMEAFDNEKPDMLLLLGDILYHGPRNDLPKEYNPKGVIELLNTIKTSIRSVQGNCDAEVDQMVLEFPILTPYTLVIENEITIFVTHGHKFNIDNPPLLQKGDVLLYGHTHIPACEEFGNSNLYINPGSVSIPKGGSTNSYMVFENKMFEWKDVETGNMYKKLSLCC